MNGLKKMGYPAPLLAQPTVHVEQQQQPEMTGHQRMGYPAGGATLGPDPKIYTPQTSGPSAEGYPSSMNQYRSGQLPPSALASSSSGHGGPDFLSYGQGPQQSFPNFSLPPPPMGVHPGSSPNPNNTIYGKSSQG